MDLLKARKSGVLIGKESLEWILSELGSQNLVRRKPSLSTLSYEDLSEFINSYGFSFNRFINPFEVGTAKRNVDIPLSKKFDKELSSLLMVTDLPLYYKLVIGQADRKSVV